MKPPQNAEYTTTDKATYGYSTGSISENNPGIPIIRQHSEDLFLMMSLVAVTFGTAIVGLIIYIWNSSRTALLNELRTISSEIHTLSKTLQETKSFFLTEMHKLDTRIRQLELWYSVSGLKPGGERSTDPPRVVDPTLIFPDVGDRLK